MRPIQPPSKLELLDSQPRPKRGPRLAMVLILLAVNGWNLKVIGERYFSGPEPAAAPTAAPTEAAAPAEAAAPTEAAAPAEATRPAPAPAEAPAPSPSADPGATPPAAPSPEQGAATPPAAAPSPARDAAPRATTAALAEAAPKTVLGDDTVLASAVPVVGPGADEATAYRVVSGLIERNHTVAEALAGAGLSPEQTHEIVSALKGVFDFRHARPGDGFRIKTTPDGQVVFFEFESSPAESYCVRRDPGGLVGYKREIPVQREVVTVSGTIHSSLYESMDAIGESPTLAMLLADVLAWDIDFYRDTRPGDTFQIAVEKYEYKGRLLHYGNVLAAEYKGGVGTYRVFRYEKPNGELAYYDEHGRSAQKALLKAPLKAVRITSRFGMRMHPILGYSKMHEGVDYGAPIGTPVWAVGDGTVVVAGWKGANGRLIGIRHANDITSWYAHLSAINVHVGQRVHQKDIIGRVGTTGRSTGPHLHYGLKRGNHHINPLTLKLPPRQPLPKDLLPDFDEKIRPYLESFEARDASLVATVSTTPPASTP